MGARKPGGIPFQKGCKAGPGRPKKDRSREGILPVPPKGVDFDLKAEYAKLLQISTAKVERLIRGKKTDQSILLRIHFGMEDRLHGKPAQAITGANGGPLLTAFTQILGKTDGGRHEKI